MGRVVHFEIHASEPRALIDFYTALLGWRFTAAEGMEYWLIQTGEAADPGIDGGLLRRPQAAPAEGQPVNAFVCTVAVDSLDKTVARAASLGAAVAMPRTPVTGVGWLAYITDPDGNLLGVLQLDEQAK